MILISYDISNTKLRTSFSKMLTSHGAIRLQYSVYELNHSPRIISLLMHHVEQRFQPLFTPDDSVVIFPVDEQKVIKMGNAIHRDQDVLFFE